MNTESCSENARKHISNEIKRQLAQKSNFSCSICGNIPIVYHHIENWSKEHSNDIEVLIPICDKCHRGIHGEGGMLFSKNELYDYKRNPKHPTILKDRFPFEQKKQYSFFIGSNFIEKGTKANLFGITGENYLMSIDTSDGNLKLSVLQKIVNGEKFYLIKENELMIDTSDIWDMQYSRNSLKIWNIINGNKKIYIDLIIKPDLIVLKKLETKFNDKPLRIYKLREPNSNKLKYLKDIITFYDKKYKEYSDKIDENPKVYKYYKGIDIDAQINQSEKERIKSELKQEINNLYKDFKWNSFYFSWVIEKHFKNSEIFKSNQVNHSQYNDEYRKYEKQISDIKEKFKSDFDDLEDIVVQYDGFILKGNIMI